MQAIASKLMNAESSILADSKTDFTPSDIIFPSGQISGPRIRYGYKISTMYFLVPDGIVSELIQKPTIYFLPNAPSWISGLINIRGNIIPVMSIEKLLKIKSSNKLRNILVFNKSDNLNALAIEIEGLPTLLEHNDNKCNSQSYPELLSDYLDAGFNYNNHDWSEFNPQRLFKVLSGKTGK